MSRTPLWRSRDNKGGLTVGFSAAETVWHLMKWSVEKQQQAISGRWFDVYFMLWKTCDWGLVGCRPEPGGPELNVFYTPLQNHMMSDLPAMANCPARKREEEGGISAQWCVTEVVQNKAQRQKDARLTTRLHVCSASINWILCSVVQFCCAAM